MRPLKPSKYNAWDSTVNCFNLSTSSDLGPLRLIRAKTRVSKSADNSSCSTSCQSDSSLSDGKIIKTKRRNKKKNVKVLPPIGVFWDIENCPIPKNKSAASVVKRIREYFFDGYREAEFIVVCDVKKENAQIVQELHDAQVGHNIVLSNFQITLFQVNLIHVTSISKNAADEKLRQSLRKYAEIYPAPSAVVLISGDINFAADLSDLRYRRKIHVILVHNNNVADALILCANESHCYSKITENLPNIKSKVKLTFFF